MNNELETRHAVDMRTDAICEVFAVVRSIAGRALSRDEARKLQEAVYAYAQARILFHETIKPKVTQ